MNEHTLWAEFKFQARLKYLAFKRTVWLMEVLFLAILVLVLALIEAPQMWRNVLIAIQLGRIAGEMWNHAHLAQGFNAVDRWTWFPFI